MQINKSILLAALGLSVAGLANADEIFVTGSTAARAAVYATMINPGSVFTTAPVITAFGGKGNGDTYMAFQGTLVGGSGTTIINCYWSGSEAGIVDVATPGKTESFISDSQITGQTSNSDSTATPATTAHPVDLALADNAQAYSPSGKNLATLTGAKVGVVPFKWVRNPGNWTGSNITDSQIRQALNGGAKLAVFTGVATDTNSYVYVAGRDSSSGTRVNAFGDAGFGVATSPKQITISSADGSMLVEATSHGINTYIGDYGQSSGGALANTLGKNTTAALDKVNSVGTTGYSAIGYLGVSDANAAVVAGATVLSYNGVAYSVAAVEEGTYSFWGNEYVYQTPNTYAGQSANIGNVYASLTSVTTGISAQADGNLVIPLSAMHATRTNPATDPAHN